MSWYGSVSSVRKPGCREMLLTRYHLCEKGINIPWKDTHKFENSESLSWVRSRLFMFQGFFLYFLVFWCLPIPKH